jgi:hypothetical protein
MTKKYASAMVEDLQFGREVLLKQFAHALNTEDIHYGWDFYPEGSYLTESLIAERDTAVIYAFPNGAMQ